MADFRTIQNTAICEIYHYSNYTGISRDISLPFYRNDNKYQNIYKSCIQKQSLKNLPLWKVFWIDFSLEKSRTIHKMV